MLPLQEFESSTSALTVHYASRYSRGSTKQIHRGWRHLLSEAGSHGAKAHTSFEKQEHAHIFGNINTINNNNNNDIILL